MMHENLLKAVHLMIRYHSQQQHHFDSSRRFSPFIRP